MTQVTNGTTCTKPDSPQNVIMERELKSGSFCLLERHIFNYRSISPILNFIDFLTVRLFVCTSFHHPIVSPRFHSLKVHTVWHLYIERQRFP